jgi:hypothetical protein
VCGQLTGVQAGWHRRGGVEMMGLCSRPAAVVCWLTAGEVGPKRTSISGSGQTSATRMHSPSRSHHCTALGSSAKAATMLCAMMNAVK